MNAIMTAFNNFIKNSLNYYKLEIYNVYFRHHELWTYLQMNNL